MASAKEYGYFIKGSKLALIEKDTALDNDVNSRDYGPDVTNVRFKSPLSSVADGLELEYIYSPKYHIKETDDIEQTITRFRSVEGELQIDGAINYLTDPQYLADGSYIVLRKAGRFSGLHKVKATANIGGTNDGITLYTKYSGLTTWSTFERTVDLYYNIDVLNDEADELPISEYLSKAVVYYLKAKMAEDRGDFNLKQAMMREFYRIVEKSDNAKIHTIRRVAPHSAAIR